MPRLAIFNMAFGFAVLFLVAAGGAFIATDMTTGYLRDKAILDSWQLLLQRSAHGHANLFGIIHICFGLTLPYSRFPTKVKQAQTAGLVLGTLAMGPVMLLRSGQPPVDTLDVLSVIMGAMLSCALGALLVHAFALFGRLMDRG